MTEKCAKTQGTTNEHCEGAAAGSARGPEIPASFQEEQLHSSSSLPLWLPSEGLVALVLKQGFGGRKWRLSRIWKKTLEKYISQLPGKAMVFCTEVTASNQIFKHCFQ